MPEFELVPDYEVPEEPKRKARRGTWARFAEEASRADDGQWAKMTAHSRNSARSGSDRLRGVCKIRANGEDPNLAPKGYLEVRRVDVTVWARLHPAMWAKPRRTLGA